MARCTYRYPDGARCTFDNLRTDAEMCGPHRLITREERMKKKADAKRPWTIAEGRPSRAKKKPELMHAEKRQIPEEPSRFHDHTAPWHCDLEACVSCKGKPTYREYQLRKLSKKEG